MEKKKTDGANIEKLVLPLTFAGIIVALAVVLVSFEWTKFGEPQAQTLGIVVEVFEPEEIPIYIEPMEEKKEREVNTELPPDIGNPPPPKPPVPKPPTPPINPPVDPPIDPPFPPEPPEPIVNDVPFIIVEDMPHFAECSGITNKEERQKCSDEQLYKHIGKNIKYPTIPKEAGISGVVYVSYVINRKGEVIDAEIVRGVNPYLDKEALRVINSLPAQVPGKQRGKSVKVKYTLPIRFRLN